MKEVTVKVEVLQRGQSDSSLPNTSKQPFSQSPPFRAQISTIFHSLEPHNIQLVPNILSTSFHQPVKSLVGFIAAIASKQLVPHIYMKKSFGYV